MAPGGDSATRLATWQKRVVSAQPASAPPVAVGHFVGDDSLKGMLKTYLGVKSVPKAVERAALLEACVRLGLLDTQDATVNAPTRAKGQPRSWKQIVKTTAKRPQPLSDDPLSFSTDAELTAAIEQHVGGGEVAPDNLSRATIVEQALSLGLITEEQSVLLPPAQLEEKELIRRWDEHHAASKKKPRRPAGRKALTSALLGLGLVSMAEASAKRIRLDRSAAAEKAKNCRTAIRSTSLTTLLQGVANAAIIQTKLKTLSEDASRLFYERSFLMWLHLHRLVRNGLELPDMKGDELSSFVRRVYTIGTQKSQLKDESIDTTYKMYRSLMPTQRRPDAVNAVTHAANAYAGAMKRHFSNMDTVRGRIRRFVGAKLFSIFKTPDAAEADAECCEDGLPAEITAVLLSRKNDIGDKPIFNILSALEDKTFDEEAMHPVQREVLQEVRDRLILPRGTNMTERWLRSNLDLSIKFCLHVVDTLDVLRKEAERVRLLCERLIADEASRPKIRTGAAKGIRFVPLNDLKRRFVTLDATDMCSVLGIDVAPGLQEDTVRGVFRKNIKRCFGDNHSGDDDNGMGEGDGRRWVFTGTCDTDGFVINPHFRSPYTAAERAIKDRQKGIPAETEAKAPLPPRLVAPPKVLLLVDPGRVNLVAITVMVDGKLLMLPPKMNPKTGGMKSPGPLKFILSCRQYHTLIGNRKRATVLQQQQRRRSAQVEEAKLSKAMSLSSLHSGSVEDVLSYLRAHAECPSATAGRWTRALSARAASDRRRRQISKDRAILRWFHAVRNKVYASTKEANMTVVWGCKVAPTGRGTLSAPTDRVAKLACRVKGWTIVSGDEFRTSRNSCVPPHSENLSPRFSGQKVIRRVLRPSSDRFSRRVRQGFILGLDAKRLLSRSQKKGVPAMRELGGEGRSKRDKVLTRWTYDGHSGQSAEEKKAAKAVREAAGLACRYVRGLRVYIKDKNIVKFVDRDVNGSSNIGTVWLGDRVAGWTRPPPFVRPVKAGNGELTSPLTPLSKQRVRAEKATQQEQEGVGHR